MGYHLSCSTQRSRPSGTIRIRYWRCYYSNTDAIIYVVDSADRERIGISKEELISMLEEDELKRAALVVLANKQDLPVRASFY